MKLTIFLFALLMCVSLGFTQNIDRIEITGKIKVESDDKEGITVYNTSSNKGTITDENGKFSIYVALNDVIAFGALQFKDFSIVIDNRIMDSKKITVVLVEEVNKLDEILILPYDLTGNLDADLEAVRTYNMDMDKIYLGMANQDEFEFTDDYKSKVENQFTNREFKHGLNLINVGGLILRPLFKKKNKDTEDILETEEMAKLVYKYDATFLNEQFKIPIDQVDAFLTFLESKPMNKSILSGGNEVLLLEFINKQSQLFLVNQSVKN